MTSLRNLFSSGKLSAAELESFFRDRKRRYEEAYQAIQEWKTETVAYTPTQERQAWEAILKDLRLAR